jgi:metal-responsive CopG/Arc/MetJ family transcriptional regulator
MTKPAKKAAAAPKAPGKTTISLRLQPKHIEQLDALVEEMGVNRSSLIQLAISDFLRLHPPVRNTA